MSSAILFSTTRRAWNRLTHVKLCRVVGHTLQLLIMRARLSTRRAEEGTCLLLSASTMSTSQADELKALFPLTWPIPNPISHPDLLTSADLHREEDLLRNPQSFRAWWTVINTARETYAAEEKLETLPEGLSEGAAALLGSLATPHARLSLQRLTYLYESALVQFPGSFKLWKSYLTMRLSYVLGKQITKKRAGGKKKFPEMKDALEEETEDLEQYEGGLHPAIGWEEWKALVAVFERALMWLPKVRHLACPWAKILMKLFT